MSTAWFIVTIAVIELVGMIGLLNTDERRRPKQATAFAVITLFPLALIVLFALGLI